jgi:hypothetical protein
VLELPEIQCGGVPAPSILSQVTYHHHHLVVVLTYPVYRCIRLKEEVEDLFNKWIESDDKPEDPDIPYQ